MCVVCIQESGELEPRGAEGPAWAGHAELLVQKLALQEGAGEGGGRSGTRLQGASSHRIRGGSRQSGGEVAGFVQKTKIQVNNLSVKQEFIHICNLGKMCRNLACTRVRVLPFLQDCGNVFILHWSKSSISKKGSIRIRRLRLPHLQNKWKRPALVVQCVKGLLPR